MEIIPVIKEEISNIQPVEIELQTELVEEEVKNVETNIQVRIQS